MQKSEAILLELLNKRNITTEKEIEEFLYPKISAFRDPFDFEDMDKIVNKILEMKNANEKIIVYGDYDVDGISGTAFLIRVFRNIGIDIDYHIASRSEDNYGVDKINIDEFYKNGYKLIITVDTSYNSLEDIYYARNLGMDVIVTDHHKSTREEGDDKILTLNPKFSSTYKFKKLSGAGVALKLAQGVYKKLDIDFSNLYKYLDIVMIGTVADVVPMTDENRLIIKYGLKQIMKTNVKGLSYLLKYLKLSKNKLNTTDISYYVSPLINSMGRIGNANLATKFLIIEDEFDIYNIIEEMKKLNKQRRSIEKFIFDDAMKKISKLNVKEDKLIFLSSNKWNAGVIGVISSKLSTMFNLPVILVAIEGKVGKASCRSIEGISIFNLLENVKDLLLRYGGHDFAAGFMIEKSKLETLRQYFLKNIGNTKSSEIGIEKEIVHDYLLDIDKVDKNIMEIMEKLSPFGTDNQHPLFKDNMVRIEAVKKFGINSKHFSCTLIKNNKKYSAVAFELSKKLDYDYFNNRYEIIYYPETYLNKDMKEYNQIVIKDIKVK